MNAIDKEVMTKFLGWNAIKPGHGPCCTCQICGRHYDDCICGFPSEDIECAMKVVAALFKTGYHYRIMHDQKDMGCVEFWRQFTDGKIKNYGCDKFEKEDELPMAICHAALKAAKEE